MEKKFTASEVRDLSRRMAVSLVEMDARPPKDEHVMAALDAYADMLEAQEKAMPAAVVKDSDALYTGWLSWTGEPAPPETKLYTHPAAADAERLAEALRQVQKAVANSPKSAIAASIVATCANALAAQENPIRRYAGGEPARLRA